MQEPQMHACTCGGICIHMFAGTRYRCNSTPALYPDAFVKHVTLQCFPDKSVA